jgi:hypothetical protein
MNIAVIGDPHLGCTTYTEKRISDFSKQFNRSIDEALKRNVKAMFILGDVFDSSAYRRSVDNFAACIGEVADSLVRCMHATGICKTCKDGLNAPVKPPWAPYTCRALMLILRVRALACPEIGLKWL